MARIFMAAVLSMWSRTVLPELITAWTN